jgi:hypothetical protein
MAQTCRISNVAACAVNHVRLITTLLFYDLLSIALFTSASRVCKLLVTTNVRPAWMNT